MSDNNRYSFLKNKKMNLFVFRRNGYKNNLTATVHVLNNFQGRPSNKSNNSNSNQEPNVQAAGVNMINAGSA